ncbi:MAG: AraC family transcriptional regulator [Xanthobacteraceae bacterium]|nr:AraC family transcriptional regulator [Xanthobacteraceae bacterium]
MKSERRPSGHLMLISPQRVFYAGLLGRPRGKTSGGFHIYCALEGSLTVTRDGRSDRATTMAVVPPYVSHTVVSDHPTVVCVIIEPETVPSADLAVLASRLAGPDGAAVRQRIGAVYDGIRVGALRPAEMTTAEFDRIVFGAPLRPRHLDPRVAATVARLVENPERAMTAQDCARETGLSQSRFLHLFKDETGVCFRAFRAWKRARHLLHFVNEDLNFAHLAQDIGYPDSTHFSHSIRRFYGLKPRAIFTGSRDLAIYRSEPRVDRQAVH